MLESYYELIARDGTVLRFLNDSLYLMNNTGFGNADISYKETQAYKQDGVSVQSWNITARNLNLEIYRDGLEPVSYTHLTLPTNREV